MTVKYFKYTFAVDGIVTPIPDPTQISNVLSYQQGFSIDYALDPSDPASLNIPLDQFNQLINDMTGAIQQVQQNGFPIHITAAMNDGSAYAYDANSFVRATNGSNYYSLIDGNTDVPPSSNWQIFINGNTAGGSILPGFQTDYWGTSLPAGYVWANGLTIGDASSNATGFADASTSALFALFWNLSPSIFPMFTSTGTLQARGASAAADFALHYAVTLPDCLERVTAGAGTMGGVADPNRITSGGAGISGATLGASGGVQTFALTTNNLAAHTHDGSGLSVSSHTHSFATPDHTHTIPTYNPSAPGGLIYGSNNAGQVGTVTTNAGGAFSGTTGATAPSVTGTTGSTGIGIAHQNTQPTIICNKIIKL